jgi:hypothetical protein
VRHSVSGFPWTGMKLGVKPHDPVPLPLARC